MKCPPLDYNLPLILGKGLPYDVYNQAAFMIIGLLGMHRHNPKDPVKPYPYAIHDWVAYNSLYCNGYNSVLHQANEGLARIIDRKIKEHLHDKGITSLFDEYGKKMSILEGLSHAQL